MIQKALLAIGALIFAVLLARWFEEGDYYDPVRGHHCAAPPSAIKDWSYTMRGGSRAIRPISTDGSNDTLIKSTDCSARSA